MDMFIFVMLVLVGSLSIAYTYWCIGKSSERLRTLNTLKEVNVREVEGPDTQTTTALRDHNSAVVSQFKIDLLNKLYPTLAKKK